MSRVLYKTPRFSIGQDVAMQVCVDNEPARKYVGVIAGLEWNKPGTEPGWIYHIDWWEMPDCHWLPIPHRDEAHESELELLSWEWLENAIQFAGQFPQHWQRSKRLNAYLQLMLVTAIATRWLTLYLFLNHCWLQSPAEKREIRARRQEAKKLQARDQNHLNDRYQLDSSDG